MKLKLRSQILLPTFLVVIVGMAIATLLSYEASKDALQDTIHDQMKQMTVGLSKQIDNWVADLTSDIQTLARQEAMRAPSSSPTAQRLLLPTTSCKTWPKSTAAMNCWLSPVETAR